MSEREAVHVTPLGRIVAVQGPSLIHGRGLFAAEDMPSGLKFTCFDIKEEKYDEEWTTVCGFNWAEEPNTEIQPLGMYKIVKDVKAGEELTIAYYGHP